MCSKCKFFPETWSYMAITLVLGYFAFSFLVESQPYSTWQRQMSDHKLYLCVSSLLLFSWVVSIQILSQTHMFESRVQTLVYPVTNLQQSRAMSLIFTSLWVFTENHKGGLSLEGAFDSCFVQPALLRTGSTKAGCSGPCPVGFSVISKDTDLTICLDNLFPCYTSLTVKKLFFLCLNGIFCI